jgi:hypothetical protein
VRKKGVDAFRVLHFFSPRSDEILCFKSVAEGYPVSLSPRPDSVVITLCALIVCRFLGYQIKNRPRIKKKKGFLASPPAVGIIWFLRVCLVFWCDVVCL